MREFSSALNHYVLTQSSPVSHEPHIASPPHFSHSPQGVAARPATGSRRATISFGPSHLYRPGSSSVSGGAPPPQAVVGSPPTLEAAYRLLIGWGNTVGSVEALDSPPTQHQLQSPYEFPQINDQPLTQQHAASASHLPWSPSADEPAMSFSVDLPFGPSLHGPASMSSVSEDTRVCSSQFLRHSPELHDGQPNGRFREVGLIEQPQPITYHRPRPQDWDQCFENHPVSRLHPTPDVDVDAYASPSLLVPLIQNFPLHHTNSIQEMTPSQSKRADLLSGPCVTHDSDYSRAPMNYEHQLSGLQDLDPELFSPNEGFSSIASASLANPYNPDPRRESDPSPVVPVAQRPWAHHHRYSIANIPFLLPLAKRFVENQFFEPTNVAYAPECSISVSSNHSSNFASKLNSYGFDSTPGTSFGNASSDHEPRSAFRRYHNPFPNFENTGLDPSLKNQNANLDVMDSPHGSFSFRSKSDGFYSPQNGPLLKAGFEGTSETGSAVFKIVDTPGVSQVPPEQDSPVNFFGNLETSESNRPSDANGGSDKGQILSDHINVFQAGYNFPFSFSGNTYRCTSPYAPSGSFVPKVSFSNVPNENDTSELPPQQSSGQNAHRLPQMDFRNPQLQRQTRLRRLSTMAQPARSESTAPPQALQPSNSSSPQSLQGVGRTIHTRKRKSMKKEKRSPTPLVEESETETYDSFEKLPGVTATKLPALLHSSQETTKPQTYDLARFGGIGQGISQYPPDLSGKARPSDVELKGILDESGEKMIPWRQELRCDEDLYTPMWCRAQNDRKEGFCDMCEGGAWFRLKNSAYWYHKQYFHGVSSTTGHYFYPPLEIKRGFSTANRQQILGLCHECNEWVGYCSVVGNHLTKKNEDKDVDPESTGHPNDLLLDLDDPAISRIPTLWYKHAHKCHRHQTCKGAKGRKKSKKN